MSEANVGYKVRLSHSKEISRHWVWWHSVAILELGKVR